MAVACLPGDAHLANTSSTGFPRSTGPFSIAVWINAVWSSGTSSFVGMYGPSVTPTTALQVGARGGELSFWTFGGGVYLSTAPPADDTWANVIYTFDGVNHMCYVNGVPGSTSTTAVTVNEIFTHIYINGYPTGGANETASYEVDSYLLYDRVLSAGEALTIYNARGSRHGISYGAVAELAFDELPAGAVVTVVRDQSGKDNHLFVEGASTTTYTYAGAVASSNLRRVL